jgi:Sulfotransferase family
LDVVVEPQQLAGTHIDAPKRGDTSDTYGFEIQGWALDAGQPVKCIEVVLGSRKTVLQVPLDRQRPDVAERFPDVPHALQCGFHAQVGALHNRANFQIELRAQLADGGRVHIGRIRARRAELPTETGAGMQPLMLNTLGRSGSTWLAWLLSCHPEIVAYEPLDFETRVGTYWISVFQDLAQPSSYFRQVVADNLENERRWWLAEGPAHRPAIGDPRLETWLGSTAVETLATMCRRRIEAFFGEVATAREKDGVRYFLEKFLLEPVTLDLLSEMYSGAREVLLVRDFRDMISSVLAFNEKRGYSAFGRERVASDGEYVKSIAYKQALGMLNRWRDRAEIAHLVRYEDLVLKPSNTLAALCRFLGIDSREPTLETTLDRATQQATSMAHHRTAADAAASVGRWRHDLSPDLAKLCNEVLGPVLIEFGYDVSSDRAAAEEPA